MWDSTQGLYFGASSCFLCRNNKQVSVIFKINTDVPDSTFEACANNLIVFREFNCYNLSKFVPHILIH